MTAEEASAFLIKKSDELSSMAPDDLTEAAFGFENEFMALLGDANTIPFETYSALSSEELLSIVRHSVEEICRIKNQDQ